MLYAFYVERNTPYNWDEWDSCVVVAKSYHGAKRIHPMALKDARGWETPDALTATRIGPVNSTQWKEGDVVCSSFNAG